MDFAKKELAKYGWKKGQGLGKSGSGIKEAIKPSYKNDLNGLGFDENDDKSFKWWEYSFNKAAANLKVKETKDGPAVIRVSPDFEISASRPKKKRKHDKLIYGNFCEEGLVEDRVLNENNDDDENNCNKYLKNISDEELFKLCGGRTIHKGARNGLCSGKLSRLARQESSLSSSKNFQISVETNGAKNNKIKETHSKKVKRKKM